jgi:hypothetical protein
MGNSSLSTTLTNKLKHSFIFHILSKIKIGSLNFGTFVGKRSNMYLREETSDLLHFVSTRTRMSEFGFLNSDSE